MCEQNGQQSTEYTAPVLSVVAPDFVRTRHTVCGSFVRKSKIHLQSGVFRPTREIFLHLPLGDNSVDLKSMNSIKHKCPWCQGEIEQSVGCWRWCHHQLELQGF